MQQNTVSQHFAAASLVLSLLQCQQDKSPASSIYLAANAAFAQTAREHQRTAIMLNAAADATRASSMVHLRQSVQQTAARMTDLEKKTMQPDALQDKSMSATTGGQQIKQKEAKRNPKAMSNLLACMLAAKQTLRRRGHTQHLQAAWPLSVAPGFEQQAAVFAQVERRLAPLQSTSPSGPFSNLVTIKLQLQPCLHPVDTSAASTEVQYWQNVALAIVANQSVMTLSNIVSKQESRQQAGITALQASPNAVYLACGSSSGKLIVLMVKRSLCLEAPAGNNPDDAMGSDRAIAGTRHGGALLSGMQHVTYAMQQPDTS